MKRNERWVLHHKKHGMLSYTTALLATGIHDQTTMQDVLGTACFLTRSTARKTLSAIDAAGYTLDGYHARIAALEVQP